MSWREPDLAAHSRDLPLPPPQALQAAVCAAGALANLALRGSSAAGAGAAGRQALVDALSTCLAGGAIYHSLGQGAAWPEPAAHLE